MESNGNYGLIIWHLRKQAGLSLQNLAERIGKSSGWLSEVENETGTCRLTEEDFERIVALLDGAQYREMFRTWVANHNNAKRVDRTFDGAVLKFIRIKKEISVREAARLLGLSKGYISKMENGLKPIAPEMRKRLMVAYGYNPGSFKNLSSDPVRSKAVPSNFKLQILWPLLQKDHVESLFNYARNLLDLASENASHTTQNIIR